MSGKEFTDKFNLLIEIEEIANNCESVLSMEYNSSNKDYLMYLDNPGNFCSIVIESEFDDISVYFDRSSQDGCHDLYDPSIRIELPYFRNMIFEDASMFILQDEYKISKFIKTIPLDILRKYLSKLKDLDDV